MLTCRECIEGPEKTAGYFRYLQSVGFFGDQPVFREHEKHCNDAIAMMKEHLSCSENPNSSKPPVHIHEEYPEHDWERKENEDIDDFAYDGNYHNGPVCKRCYYSFCIYCKPNGWNDKPCIIDKYKCPKCGMGIIKGTKFCSNCGQAVKWE